MNIEESVLTEFQVPFHPDTNETNFLTAPEIRPLRWDLDYRGYFNRIGNWGAINIYHTDPEHKIRKEKITQEKFIKLVSSSDLMKLYGKFVLELRGVNEVDFIRTYVGMDGKMYEEIFKIKIDLKPALKQGFRWWDGLLG